MGGSAQRPVWRGNEPKTTGARSARARTRGKNQLVLYIQTVYGCGGVGGEWVLSCVVDHILQEFNTPTKLLHHPKQK